MQKGSEGATESFLYFVTESNRRTTTPAPENLYERRKKLTKVVFLHFLGLKEVLDDLVDALLRDVLLVKSVYLVLGRLQVRIGAQDHYH